MNNLCSKDSLPQHGDKESGAGGGGDTDTPKGFIQSHQTFINIVSGEVGRHVPALLFIPFIFLTIRILAKSRHHYTISIVQRHSAFFKFKWTVEGW